MLEFLEDLSTLNSLSIELSNTSLWCGIHLVDSDNQLLHSKGVGQESVFSSLAVLRDTSFKFPGTRGNDQDSTVSLRGASYHVLDKVPVTRSINDGNIALGSLKLPKCNINGDTTLTLSLELIQDPCIL